jgi:hypothetical protein
MSTTVGVLILIAVLVVTVITTVRTIRQGKVGPEYGLSFKQRKPRQ